MTPVKDRVIDLMTDESKWTKFTNARAADESSTCSCDNDACKRCLFGWCIFVYGAEEAGDIYGRGWITTKKTFGSNETVVTEAPPCHRLNSALDEMFPDFRPAGSVLSSRVKPTFVDFNDSPLTTFAMVRQLVAAAGV